MSKRVPGRGRRHREPRWDHTGMVPGAIGRLAQPGGVCRERCEQRSDTIRCTFKRTPWLLLEKGLGVPRAQAGSPLGRLHPLSGLGKQWGPENGRN